MEIKVANAIPLWMVNILTREKIYRTPFSKYGCAYASMLNKKPNKIKQGVTL